MTEEELIAEIEGSNLPVKKVCCCYTADSIEDIENIKNKPEEDTIKLKLSEIEYEFTQSRASHIIVEVFIRKEFEYDKNDEPITEKIKEFKIDTKNTMAKYSNPFTLVCLLEFEIEEKERLKKELVED